MFFEIFVEKGDTVQFFWEIAWTVKFSLANLMFLGGCGFNVLIHKNFLKEWEKIISLVLKAKQEKAIQLTNIFCKFQMNQFFNQFLLFLHFPGLWNL